MQVPKPEVMFERLLKVLKLERSVFVPKTVLKGTTSVLNIPALMTRGIALNVQSFGDGRRIQVDVYDGQGTGCSQILYSRGAKEFAEKVWAIEAGIELAKALGTNTGGL